MPLTLLCARPHVRFVDFRTERFVVAKICGLDVDGKHLERGDELPKGVLSETALRQIYDTPLRLIETVEFAFTQDEALRTECLARGVQLSPVVAKPKARVIAPDLDRLPYGDLVELCQENGIPHVGNSKQLRARLKALVG